MPKIMPNQTCPCSSGIKYKKCCMIKNQTAQYQEEVNKIKAIDTFMQGTALDPGSTYINQLRKDLSATEIKVFNITELANSGNFNKICSIYCDKGYIALERNADTDSIFNNKKAKTENMMVVKRNHYLCYDHDTEYSQALVEIRKWN